MAAAAPQVEWTDGTALFAGLAPRRSMTPNGSLLARADAIAVAALREAETGKAKDAGTLAGLIEQSARLAGAEEAYIAVAPDLAADRRLNRTSQPTPLGGPLRGARFDRLQGLLGSPHAHVRRGHRKGRRVARRCRAVVGGKTDRRATRREDQGTSRRHADNWTAESCTGSYPLSRDCVVARTREGSAGERPVPGADRRTDVDGTPWIGAAPLIVGQGRCGLSRHCRA